MQLSNMIWKTVLLSSRAGPITADAGLHPAYVEMAECLKSIF